MSHRYLLVSDFDGTLGKTFDKSPNGIGVEEAVEFAIGCLFEGEGLREFRALGGLQNRAPSELIGLILQAECRHHLIACARQYYETHHTQLRGCMPDGKGVKLAWITNSEESLIAELFVLTKLRRLLQEVGSRFPNGAIWPQPCTGVLQFFETINCLNQNSCQVKIDVAIVSSGHDMFIERTFCAWGIQRPQIMVTEDDVRHINLPLVQKVKPSAYLVDLIEQRHREVCQYSHVSIRPYGVLFGDDLNKDGKLAFNSGMDFGWYNPSCRVAQLQDNAFTFSDWTQVATLLVEPSTQKLLCQGTKMATIIQSWKNQL